MNCDGCTKIINTENYLNCHTCCGKYHHECLNLTTHQFKLLSVDYRSTWTCPACSNITRRRATPDTPVRQNSLIQTPQSDQEQSLDLSCEIKSDSVASASSLPTSMFPLDKFHELLNTINTWRHDINANMNGIRDDIKSSLSNIQTELKAIQSEQIFLKDSVKNMNREINSLKDSIQFQSNEHDDLKKRVDQLACTSGEQTENAVANLQSKIEGLEQQARQCNIEICNLPERKNEDLLNIVGAITSAIRVNVSDRDIVSIHRVPHAHQMSYDRPKNVIVKFNRRIQRDNVLAAYRKIKSLKSDQIGISGTSVNVYINEHLTLKKKQLFRKCRNVAKELHYKYVWIKNSTILVREKDDSPAIVIRTEDDFKKLKHELNF